MSRKEWLDVEDAIANALSFLESLGYRSGDVYNDLQSAHELVCESGGVE